MNLKLRAYIHVRSSVAKELDISMSAIGFSRTPFPLQFQPSRRIFLSAMTLTQPPMSNSKITFFPLARISSLLNREKVLDRNLETTENESARGEHVSIIYELNIAHIKIKA